MEAPRTQCSCVEEAARAWERIESMVEISLDVIIIASAQTIDFSLQSQKCQSHSFAAAAEVKDTLLQIYAKLVDFLQRAIAAYTGTTPLPSTPEPALNNKVGDQNSHWPLDHRALGSPSSFQHRALPEQQPPGLGAVYIPTKMALGDHELDSQQSKYLALDIFCRTLKNFARVLQQMGGQETAEIKNVDARVLGILLQVTRLIENVSATLHTFPQ